MVVQKLLVDKTQELHAEVDALVEAVQQAIQNGTPVHEVEEAVLRRALAIGRLSLDALFGTLGTGDVGATCPLPNSRVLKRLERLRPRPYRSVFGEFHLERCVYAEREGRKIEFVPLDARLGLPEGKCSFLLQDFDQNLAMEQPFGQVSSTIAQILGVEQHVDSLERMNRKMAEDVEAFHFHQPPPATEEEAAILVETADGKGVPIRRPADASPIQDHQRRSGPKPDRKKIATVASVYTVDPVPRTPEEVVESLFQDPREKAEGKKTKPIRPRPCQRRIRACLNFGVVQGAQPMLDLRRIFLCNQWDAFIQFYITRQIAKTHPFRDMIHSLPWQIAA